MTSENSCTTQREQVSSLVQYLETPSLFFNKSSICSSPLVSLLSVKDINLNIFHDINLPNQNEQQK